MNKEFSIEMCGDLDFEGMVIDVTYNNETIASINYDKGIDNIEVEILPKSEKFVFSLDDFFLILKKAEKLAIKCAKEDEELRKKGIEF